LILRVFRGLRKKERRSQMVVKEREAIRGASTEKKGKREEKKENQSLSRLLLGKVKKI